MWQPWQQIICLAMAGGLGTLSRVGLAALVYRFLLPAFPWGTLVVNAVGCLLFGLVWSIAEHSRLAVSWETRAVLLVGFMGGFTTFSTFAFETAQLIREAQWLLAAANVLAQNAVGILLLFAGLLIGRGLFGPA